MAARADNKCIGCGRKVDTIAGVRAKHSHVFTCDIDVVCEYCENGNKKLPFPVTFKLDRAKIMGIEK